MAFTVDTSALDALRQRLEDARAEVQPLLEQAVQEGCEIVRQELSDAAPRGKEQGPPPEGDADGPLADSFSVEMIDSASNVGAAAQVVTSQPTKLRYVTQGTGLFGQYGQRIIPTTKQALYWVGAAHPVRSVAGQKPNDFVTPVIDNADVTEPLQNAVEEIAAILEGA